MSSSVLPPSFLRAETAESYSTSIRINADGLTFVLFGAEGQELHRADLCLEPGYPDLSTAVGELFFRNPFLCYPYKSTTFYYSPSAYTLVPLDLYEEDRKDVWLKPLLDKDEYLNGSSAECELLTYKFENEGKVLLAYYDKALLQFLRRTLLVIEPVPYFVPLIGQAASSSISLGVKVLYLFPYIGGVDAVLMDSSQLAFAVHYSLTPLADAESSAHEILFYLFSLWRALGLDAEKDLLHIEHQGETMIEVMEHLRGLAQLFISHIV